MRWVALLVVACACDRVLGLRDTQLADGPAPDSPPVCPALLGAPPTFSGVLRQVIPQQCTDYTIAPLAGRALTVCFETNATISDYYVAEGAVAGPVAKVSGFDALTNVRIDPSGDTAFAFDGAAYVRYQRTGDLVWSRGGPIARFASYTHATTATAGANPHVLLGDGSQFIELEDDGTDTWSTVTGMYSGTMFAGATMISRPTWTVDGLRLVFVAASLIASPGQSFAVMYASRQNIGDTFGPAVEAAAFEPYVDPSRVFVQQILGYLDDDCGRFYFAALSSVLYAQQ